MVGFLGMLGQGLSAAGNSVAQFASDAGVIQMKADLERQSQVLANQLATERETTLEAQRQTGAQTLQTNQQQFTSGEAEKTRTFETGQTQAEIASRERLPTLTANAQVAAANQEAADTEARIKREGKDPDYLAAQAALMKADPSKVAEANERNAQAFLANQQGKEAQSVYQLRQQIMAEQGKAQPDQGRLDSLNNQLNTLLTNPQAMSAMRTAAVGAARIAEDAAARGQTALDTLTSKLADPILMANKSAAAEVQNQQRQLQIRQKTLNDNADDARREMYSYFGMKAKPDATTEAPATPKAPSDVSQRETGKTYMLPDGRQGMWMGNGWKIVAQSTTASAQ